MLSESTPNSDELARLFHETYERLAPSFDYSTRIESAVPWADVPKQNKELMVAVADAVIAAGYRKPSLVDGDTAELIEDARKWPSDMGEGALMNALADLVESLSTQRQAIPRYAMLDVWMALYGSDRSQEFEPFYDEHGYAETWAQLCAEVRAAGYRPQRTVTTADELNALWLNAVILDRGGMARQAWSSSKDELYWEEPDGDGALSSTELIEHVKACGVTVAFDVLYDPKEDQS